MNEGDATPAGPEPSPFALPEGYDAVAEAKRLMRVIRAGALATLTPEGFPFASLTTVATAMDGAPLLLMSSLSAHTRHLMADGRASLLLAQSGKGDPLAHPRLTLVGRMVRLEEAARASARTRFLARHPKAALYADFGDFSFWRMEIERAHLNGGFARAATFQAPALVTDVSSAGELAEIEMSAIEHLNADHAEAVRLYATRIAGEADGRWRVTGVDPEGLDLAAGDLATRVLFDDYVVDGAGLRRATVALAAAARAR